MAGDTVVWPVGAREFVVSARVGRLATASASGAPHVVPVCFAVEDHRVYSVVDAKPKRNPKGLKRLRNVAENASVALLVDHYEDDWSKLVWVMLRGAAALVAGEREHAQALALLRARYPQYREMRLTFSDNPMLRIDIASVTAWRSQ
jgi:PPOX class probable F420-dependent enzyme